MSTQPSLFAILQFKDFRHFILSRFLFVSGLRMTAGIVGWWVNDLTHNPFYTGLIGLSEVIPAIGFALYAGVVVDRSDRKKILLSFQAIYLLCIALLIAVAYQAKSFGSINSLLYTIYAIIFVTGIVRSFLGPAMNATLPKLLEKEHLTTGVTFSSFVWLLASTIGPVFAGFIIAGISLQAAFIFVGICVIVAIYLMNKIPPQPSLSTSQAKTWQSVKEGLHFVMKSKSLLGALCLDMFAVFFGGVIAMIPYYASDILHVGATGYGWLNAAEYVGSILSLIFLLYFPMTKMQGKKLFFAVAGFGIMTIIFAVSKVYWISLVSLLLLGICDGVSVVIRSTILTLLVPDDMRGRVSSVNSVFINSSNELGMMESGVAAKLFGNVPSVIFGGVMTLLVVSITWFKAPALKKMEY